MVEIGKFNFVFCRSEKLIAETCLRSRSVSALSSQKTKAFVFISWAFSFDILHKMQYGLPVSSLLYYLHIHEDTLNRLQGWSKNYYEFIPINFFPEAIAQMLW